MSDHKDDQPYLLDDDDYVKLMEASYKEAGYPLDETGARRNWMKLSNATAVPPSATAKKSRTIIAAGSFLGIAAALFLLVRLQPADVHPDLPVKGGSEFADYQLVWVGNEGLETETVARAIAIHSKLRVASRQPLVFAIYGSSGQNSLPKLLQGPYSLMGGATKELTLAEPDALAMEKICVIAGENEENYKKAIALIDNVWQMLATPQCISIER